MGLPRSVSTSHCKTEGKELEMGSPFILLLQLLKLLDDQGYRLYEGLSGLLRILVQQKF